MYSVLTPSQAALTTEWQWPLSGVHNQPSLVRVGVIEIDTLEYQQTEKIETELKDVDRIRIRKVYACCPGWHSGGS
jgi:hypothetical protein